MSYSNAGFLNIFVLLLLITVFIVCNPLGGYHIDVNIFLEESNTNVTKIAQKAFERYQFDPRNKELEKRVHLNFKLVRYNRTINNILVLGEDLFGNLSASLRLAIFVEISSHELVLSSLMERSNIVTVGLFQTEGVLWTQVRSS